MATNDKHNLDVDVRATDNITIPLKGIESGIIRFVGAVTASLAALRVATFEIGASADLQTELLNIKKTTEFADDTIKQFSVSLREMSKEVDVSAVNLARIAAVGGQLGLGSQGSEALEQFTESTARMSSVLDIAVDQAANGIAKITNIFDIGLRDAERIVSSFNELSNNSTASGEALLDVVQRIGNAGGTVNLQQSLGLAATGVDFGLTLETIGTSFTKIFLDMQSKSAQFANAMKIDTQEWAETVEKDGIGALKQYLTFLRTLRSDERARVAEQLTGGGRVFSLVNKLVQDTNNVILDKNIQFAVQGWESGTSAIREQQTVLQGLNAQIDILANHFVALATVAGDEALPEVTQIVRLLQEWLASDETKDGILQISAAIGSIADAAGNVALFISQLEVNWQNLFVIVAAFLALRLARSMTEWIGSFSTVQTLLSAIGGTGFPKLKSDLKTITDQARTLASNLAGLAGAAISTGVNSATRLAVPQGDTAGQAAAASRAAQGAEAVRGYTAALKQQAAEMLGLGAIYQNNIALQEAKTAVTLASADVEKAANAVALAGAQERAVLEKSLYAQSLARAEFASQQRILLSDKERRSIEINIERQRALSRATNAQEVAEINARYARLSANSALHYERQIAGLQRHLQERIARIGATYTQELALAQEVSAAKLAIFEAASARELAAQNAVGEAQKKQVVTLGSALIAAVGRIGGLLVRVFSGFLWLQLIATFLEMFGLLKPLSEAFLKLGDAIGVTSEAARRANQEHRITMQRLREEEVRTRALVQEYFKLAQARGGLSERKFDAQVQAAGQNKTDTAKVVADSLFQASAAQAVTETTQSLPDVAAVAGDAAQQRVDETVKKIELLTRRTDLLRDSLNRLGDSPSNAQQADRFEAEINANVAKINDLNRVLIEANSELSRASSTSVAEIIGDYARVAENLEAFGPAISKSMTDATAEVVRGSVATIVSTQQAISQLEKELDDYREKIDQGESAAGSVFSSFNDNARELDKNKQILKATSLALIELRGTQARAFADLEEFESKYGKDAQGTLPRALLGRFSDPEQMQRLLTLLDQVQQSIGFTGTVLTDATKGDDKGGDTAAVSAGDLALARLRARREALSAEIRLVRQNLDQELDAYTFAYQRGTVALETFYATRQRIIEEGLRQELRLRQAELAEAEQAKKNAGKVDPNQAEAQRLAAQAQINRITGDITLLQDRLANVGEEVSRERVLDTERTHDALLQLEAQYYDATGDLAQAAATQNAIAYRDSFRRLQAERLDNETRLAAAVLEQNEAAATQARDALASVDREIQIIVTLTNIDEVTARVDQFIADTEEGLRSGLFRPETATDRVQAFMDAIGTQLYSEVNRLKEEIARALIAGRDTTELEQALTRARLRVISLEDAIVSVHERAIDAFSEDMEIKIEVGLIGLTEAGEQLAQFVQSQAELLRTTQILPLLSQVEANRAAGTPNLEDEARLDRLILQYERYRNTVSDLASEINGSVKEAFTDFFSSVASGTKTLSDAWEDLGQTFRRIAAETLASDVVDKFLGPVLSGTGSFGDIVSRTLTPGRQKGDTKSNPLWVQFASDLKLDQKERGQNTPTGTAAGADGEGGIGGLVSGVFDDLGEGIENGVESVRKLFSGESDIFSFLEDFGSNLLETFKGVFSALDGLFSGSGGGSTGFLGLLAGLFHEGGVVGSGGGTIAVNPAVFQNATRYHTGGLPGLAADEVPAILQKGEEVLTRNDSRNVLNGGKSGSDRVVQPRLDITPEVLNRTMRDWLEGELGTILANR